MSDEPAMMAYGKHCCTLLASGLVSLLLTPFEAPAAQAEQTVHGLRQAGWVLVEKSERDEWHPGIPPYEKLRRQLYVVTYTFEKEGKSMTCSLTRDVMFDTFKQTCASTE